MAHYLFYTLYMAHYLLKCDITSFIHYFYHLNKFITIDLLIKKFVLKIKIPRNARIVGGREIN